MFWLLACIVFTSFLIISFKYFEQYKVATIPAIAFNYLTCATLGFLFQSNYATVLSISFLEPWVMLSLALGVSFIIVFYFVGINTQKNGITIGAVSNKLSVVIPICITIAFYGEKLTVLKGTGIFLALLSVVLANVKKQNSNAKNASLLLPLIVFIGSGLTDSALNFIQKFYLPEGKNELMIFFVFGAAAIAGFAVVLYNYFKYHLSFGKKEIFAGFLLGLPNFGSMIAILNVLQSSGIEHSIVWPLINVGVIVFSTFYSVVFFKEKLLPINILGIFIALMAIVMMALS